MKRIVASILLILHSLFVLGAPIQINCCYAQWEGVAIHHCTMHESCAVDKKMHHKRTDHSQDEKVKFFVRTVLSVHYLDTSFPFQNLQFEKHFVPESQRMYAPIFVSRADKIPIYIQNCLFLI